MQAPFWSKLKTLPWATKKFRIVGRVVMRKQKSAFDWLELSGNATTHYCIVLRSPQVIQKTKSQRLKIFETRGKWNHKSISSRKKNRKIKPLVKEGWNLTSWNSTRKAYVVGHLITKSRTAGFIQGLRTNDNNTKHNKKSQKLTISNRPRLTF